MTQALPSDLDPTAAGISNESAKHRTKKNPEMKLKIRNDDISVWKETPLSWQH